MYYVYSEMRRMDARYRMQIDQLSTALQGIQAAQAAAPTAATSAIAGGGAMDLTQLLPFIFGGAEDEDEDEDEDDLENEFCVIEEDEEAEADKTTPAAMDTIQEEEEGAGNCNEGPVDTQEQEQQCAVVPEIAETAPEVDNTTKPAPAKRVCRSSKKP
jgi:hypothetical protein